MGQPIVLMPNSLEGSGGLVKATLKSAFIRCTSGSSATAGTAEGGYQLQIEWWGKRPTEASPQWHTAVWKYDSAINSSPVLSSGVMWQLDDVLSDGTKLSDVITSSGAPATISEGSTTGLRGFPSGVFTLTTAPTLANEFSAGYSAINVQLGLLTCVADDVR
jgi:hypothetical protein